MSPLQTLRDTAARLSPRERLLIGAALAIGFIIAAVYGVMLPGQAAARSAADRNALAATDLAEARVLAANIGTSSALTEEALLSLVASASARGLEVTDSRIVDGAAVLRLASPGSIDVLAWAAEATSAATLTSLSITTAREGGVTADASFGGAS
jgi:Type II secretion system (T2SS), protein M